MKKTLIVCAAALTALSLNGGSLMPVKGKISIAGADGSSFKTSGDKLVLRREKPGVQVFLRGIVRFKPQLSANFAPDDALVIELKTEKPLSLRTRWRKADKMMCHTPEMPVTGKNEFQEIVLPLPETGGRPLESLDLQFTPDPGIVEIRKIAIAKPKQITLRTEGNPCKAQDQLVFKGITAEPEAEVKKRSNRKR